MSILLSAIRGVPAKNIVRNMKGHVRPSVPMLNRPGPGRLGWKSSFGVRRPQDRGKGAWIFATVLRTEPVFAYFLADFHTQSGFMKRLEQPIGGAPRLDNLGTCACLLDGSIVWYRHWS